jgi:hypothetical protein
LAMTAIPHSHLATTGPLYLDYWDRLRRERVARASGPGEGYHRKFFEFLQIIFIAVPLTRRFAAPSPVGRGSCENMTRNLRID